MKEYLNTENSNKRELRLKKREIQQQESLITEGTTLEANFSTDGTTLDASLVTEGTTLEACSVTEGAVMEACLVTEGVTLKGCLVTKGIALDDNLVIKDTTDNSVTSSKQLDESSNSGNDANADIGPSYDSDTVSKFSVTIWGGCDIFCSDGVGDVVVAGQTDQTLRMLLPKEDNVQTGKLGLGFKNKNDVENPGLLSKAKELAPCLYNIDEMEKHSLSDHKIISEEELKCEAEKRLKVKQRKSSISYHGFVYAETPFEEPPKVPLKRRNLALKQDDWFQSYGKSYEDNIYRISRNRLSEEFEPLVKDVNLQLNCFEKGLVKEMKDDLKCGMSLKDEFDETSADVKEEMTKRCAQFEKDFAKLEAHCISLKLKSKTKSLTSVQNGQVLSNKSDEAKIKFDTEDLETINIELEYSVASLLKENEHLKTIYQNLFDSIKRSRVQTKISNVSKNEAENFKSQLSEFANKKFNKVFQKIESMKKKKFGSRISNDFLQKSL
ncbi:hypothetical protein Tco_0394051 [Tanacetum coccineum]